MSTLYSLSSMAALQTHRNYTQFCNYCSPTAKLPCRQNPSSVPYPRNSSFTEKVRVWSSRTRRGRDGLCPICCRSKTNAEAENVSLQIQEEKSETERPPFDINLAVILAGFAFEAYSTPPVSRLLNGLVFVLITHGVWANLRTNPGCPVKDWAKYCMDWP